MGLLMAYLASHLDQNSPRELICECLWPEQEPEVARSRLRETLASLRRQLEPPGVEQDSVLIASRFGIRLLGSAARADVHEFREAATRVQHARTDKEQLEWLQRAAEFYRGDFLPGYYSEWISEQRSELNDLHANVLRQLVRIFEKEDDLERASFYARKVVESEPYSAEAREQLIRFHAQMGQDSAAIAQFEDFREVLCNIGEEPSEELQEFVARLASRLSLGAEPGVIELSKASAAVSPSSPKQERRSPHLPFVGSKFFGREAEIATVFQRLEIDTCRLVVLTGPGGSGKTRLSIEIGKLVTDKFGGAVWFVSLAEARDANGILEAIHRSMRLPYAEHSSISDEIKKGLEHIRALLIFDNCEHLPQEDLLIGRDLLRDLPQLTILATSRHRLSWESEYEVPIEPLAMPPANIVLPEDLINYPSVQLFFDRARAIRPDFQLNERNAPTVAAICRHLEGLPLSLELAASWAQTLGPSQMLKQLENRFEFLTSRRKDISDRHRTLRAAIGYSYELLPSELREFLVRLSVLTGAWTLEAATAIALPGEPHRALDFIAELRERSLVLTQANLHPFDTDKEDSLSLTYRMLEATREFVLERLTGPIKEESEQRHAEYFLELCSRNSDPDGSDNDLRLMASNVLRAIEYFESARDYERALQTVVSAQRLWTRSAFRKEGRDFTHRLARKIQRTQKSSALMALAYKTMGNIALVVGDYQEAKTEATKALEIFTSIQDLKGQADVLNNLGIIALYSGNPQEAKELFDRCLELRKTIGDRAGLAIATNNMGSTTFQFGEFESAERLFRQGNEIYLSVGNQSGYARGLSNLANTLVIQNRLDEAEECCHQALAIHRSMDDEGEIGTALFRLAMVSYYRGRHRLALQLGAQSLPMIERCGSDIHIYPCLGLLGLCFYRLGKFHDAIRLLAASSLRPSSPQIRDRKRQRHDLDVLIDSTTTELKERFGEYVFEAEWIVGRSMSRRMLQEYIAQVEPLAS